MEYLGPTERVRFPEPRRANRWGVVAIGGNLSPGFLLSAYEQGIFPWYEQEPITWFSPDPRFLLPLNRFHVPSRLRRAARRHPYRIMFDHDFRGVIEGCREKTDRREATWITTDMVRGYAELHRLGIAHSVEVTRDGTLVGGLYGVVTGGLFAGESMFSRERDASKYALTALVGLLAERGATVIDCQSYTDYLAAFGAVDVPRGVFLNLLSELSHEATLAGTWAESDGAAMLAHGLEVARRADAAAAPQDGHERPSAQ